MIDIEAPSERRPRFTFADPQASMACEEDHDRSREALIEALVKPEKATSIDAYLAKMRIEPLDEGWVELFKNEVLAGLDRHEQYARTLTLLQKRNRRFSWLILPLAALIVFAGVSWGVYADSLLLAIVAIVAAFVLILVAEPHKPEEEWRWNYLSPLDEEQLRDADVPLEILAYAASIKKAVDLRKWQGSYSNRPSLFVIHPARYRTARDSSYEEPAERRHDAGTLILQESGAGRSQVKKATLAAWRS